MDGKRAHREVRCCMNKNALRLGGAAARPEQAARGDTAWGNYCAGSGCTGAPGPIFCRLPLIT